MVWAMGFNSLRWKVTCSQNHTFHFFKPKKKKKPFHRLDLALNIFGKSADQRMGDYGGCCLGGHSMRDVAPVTCNNFPQKNYGATRIDWNRG